jgi:hypothetical protein
VIKVASGTYEKLKAPNYSNELKELIYQMMNTVFSFYLINKKKLLLLLLTGIFKETYSHRSSSPPSNS